MGKAKDKTVVAASGSGIVVGGQSRWHVGPKMRVVLTMLAIVLVAGGAGVGLRWLQQPHSPKAKVPGALTHKLTKAERAQQVYLEGQTEVSQKMVSDALKDKNLSTDEKYQLYYQQGATYQNTGDNKSALDSYKNAAAAKPTQAVYESLGAVCVLLGDKPGAVDYYKKAIQLITGPLSADDTKVDQQIIRDLGGQP
jgi:tetratricopeptide (TPR) repeat protein